MAFWVILAEILKVILTIKKYADLLSGLSSGRFIEGYITSLMVNGITNAIVKSGIPLDRLDIEGQADQWVDTVLKETNSDLLKLGLILNPNEIVSKLFSRFELIRNGRLTGNGVRPIRNISKSADPIILSTGEFEREVTDLQLNGAGIDFEFRRIYRSGSAYYGPLGPNWDHNYNLRLYEENEFVVIQLTGQLSECRFVQHPKFGDARFSYYVPPDGIHDVLTQDNTTSFLLQRPHGIVYRYEPTEQQPGEHRIKRIEDRFGNYLEFVYTSDDLLHTVYVNSRNRYVLFHYDEFLRINSIEDHAGRIVLYNYDDFGNLEHAIGPALKGSKSNRLEKYDYDMIGQVRKLTRVWDMVDRILVENEYEQNELSDHFGMVVKQRENKGESIFFYENIIEDNDPAVRIYEKPVLRVWESSRNGHQVEHVFNSLGNELMTRERLVEGCLIHEAITHNRYNADGQIIAHLDPNGNLTQFLFGRDHISDFVEWPDIDPVIAEVTITGRMSFGNLLATVSRGRLVDNIPTEVSTAAWNHLIPLVKIRDHSEDVVIKYCYNSIQLLTSKSDPRHTVSADPLHVESSIPGDPSHNPADPQYLIHQHHLARFNYSPGPRFELQQTIYPDRTRPSLLNSTSAVTDIIETILQHNIRGQPVKRKDRRGYIWFDEYHDSTSGSKEGFLRHQLIPHYDWIIDKNVPDILEIQLFGAWQRLDHHLSCNGTAGDSMKLLIEGTRIHLYQSSNYTDILSNNTNVQIRIDGNQMPQWNQQSSSIYVAENLRRGIHTVEIFSETRIPFSVGRVHSYVLLEYQVDNLGRVIKETDARGNDTSYEVDILGRNLKVTRGSANNISILNYEYDPAGRLTLEQQKWSDDANNIHPEVAIDSRYNYDQGGNLISESYGSSNNQKRRTSQYIYDAEDNLRDIIDAGGSHTHLDYDALNRQIRTVRAACSPNRSITNTRFDLSSNVLSEMNPRGALYLNGYIDSKGIFHSGIDSRGRVHIHSDPLGNMIITDYDAMDRPRIVRRFQLRSDHKYEMISRRETVYDEHGDAIKLIDAIFDTPILTDNPWNDPDVEFSHALISNLIREATMEFHLDAHGNMEATRNPDDGVQLSRFDAQGRCYDQIDTEGRRVFRIFDGNDNIVKIYTFEPVRDETANKIMHHEVFLDQYEYDQYNRQILRIDTYNNQWKTQYDSLGNKTRTTDPLGNIIRFEYDAFGNQISRIHERTETGIGEGTSLSPFITGREYDQNDNVIAIIDPLNNRAEFRYDELNRLVESQFLVAQNGPIEYRRYDSAGNMISRTDCNGLVYKMNYDLLDRHTNTEIENANVLIENRLSPLSATFIALKYDAAGNCVQHENDYCKTEIKRDSRGLPIYENVKIRNIIGSPEQLEIKRVFDLSGRRTKLLYPSSREVIYRYDHLGRVVSVTNNTSPPDYPGKPSTSSSFELAHYSYDGHRLSRTDLGNGLRLKKLYDGRGYLLEETLLVTSSRRRIWRLQQLRDRAGFIRIENVNRRTGSKTRRYMLDSLYRLVHYEDNLINWINPSSVKPAHESIDLTSTDGQLLLNNVIGSLNISQNTGAFTYDPMGNRITSREPGLLPTIYTSDSFNRYTRVDNSTWKYDLNGNQRSDGTMSFMYDLNNALQSILHITSGENLVTYFRDAVGRVVAELTSRGPIFRIYDGVLSLVEINGTNRTEFTPGHNYNRAIHAAEGGEDYWLTYDGLGTLRLLTDSSGTVVSMPSFRPFGLSEDNELMSSPFHFGYAGMWYSNGLPFYHSEQRSYRPDAGRHLQRDPAGIVDDLNPYVYVSNNPINYTDPRGLGKRKAGEKFVGWVVKRTGSRLIRQSVIFTEKEAAKMFSKGVDVMVKGGKQVAKNIAKKVKGSLGADIWRDLPHRLKSGKLGLPHYHAEVQGRKIPAHIFYEMIGGIMLPEEAFGKDLKEESIDISAIYTNVFPGPSIGNAFTVTYWTGEDSFLSYIDWINPGELMGAGGDLGRWVDRELMKDLIGINITINQNGEPITTYSINEDGTLQSVSHWKDRRISSTVSGEEFLKSIEDPNELNRVLKELEQAVNE